MKISHRDHALFSQEMFDVAPIKQQDKVILSASSSHMPGQTYRREAAQYTAHEKESALSLVLNKKLGQLDWLIYKRDGIQNGVFKNLRTGRYALEATLNLNDKAPEQACYELLQFVQECQKNNLRSTLITFNRTPTGLTIKSYLAQWLPKIPEVQAFHTALQHHGGDRAVYVLFRKSASKKASTRERHAARLAQ